MSDIVAKTNTQNEISRMTPRHHAILDYMIAGKTSKEIAEIFNMHPNAVYRIVNAPQFQHQLSIRRGSIDKQLDHDFAANISETDKILKQAAARAATKLSNLVDSENEQISLKSASEILDRSGHPKTQRTETNKLGVVVLDKDDITRIQETMNMDKTTQDSNIIDSEAIDAHGDE